MDYSIAQMDANTASAIAAWRYDGEYAFYDWDADPDDLADLLNPAGWGVTYFIARDQIGALVGFFSFRSQREVVEIGLGLRPDLTGKGLGRGFMEAGLAYARERFAPSAFRLRVATFNRRAISVYERVGFRQVRIVMQHTNGGIWEFLEMVLDERE